MRSSSAKNGADASARYKSERVFGVVSIAIVVLAPIGLWGGATFGQLPVATDINDFFLPGTQPNAIGGDLFGVGSCLICHGDYDPAVEPYFRWKGSMMAQSARDPLFYACLAVANQDATDSGDLCIRCHSPRAWLGGRSTPTDASFFEDSDRDGVSCDFCHRLVDPVYNPGVSPTEDVNVLADTPNLPTSFGSGQYIVDSTSSRRGPFDDPNAPHPWIYSPYHQEAQLCANCHDVSNPVYERDVNDTYVLTTLGEPNPSTDQYDHFPIERTYSEWSQSAFTTGIDMNGRFGGNKVVVATCQDCHMPDGNGRACLFPTAVDRADLPLHDFSGANTWVPYMIIDLAPTLYPADDVDPNALIAGVDRARSMLERAANMTVQVVGGQLQVRVFNETGHKLPSGYPEGRRMWINVQYYDVNDVLVTEYGAYDDINAILTTGDTTVFEAKLGIDADVAAVTGLPQGESFHFVLNNMYVKDNRIPPRGFNNAQFQYIQAAPVGETYADGQFWHDSTYAIPPTAVRAEVRLYHQVASREYIEFLMSENTTDTTGVTLYNEWMSTGMSPPTEMVSLSLNVGNYLLGDQDGDGDVDLGDFSTFALCFSGPILPAKQDCGLADVDMNDEINLTDFSIFALNFTGPM